MIQERKQGWLAALTLVVWAPMAGELFTSSAPPFVFFIPWVFLLFAFLYGLGALIIREVAVRFRLGWPAVLLLGAAYGILEEGLGAKSFFDAHWRAIGPLGEHGRAMGVNWIWTIGLTGFHAFYSVGLSILTLHVMFPRVRRTPWLGKPGLTAAMLLFGLDALLFYQKGNEKFSNTPAQSAVCVVLILLLVAAAFWLPRRNSTAQSGNAPAWRKSFGAGFGAAAAFTALLYFFPGTGSPAWLTGVLLVALFAACALVFQRWTGGGSLELSRSSAFGILAGVYGFFAAQAPLQEINPARPDSAAGMTGVGVLLALGLWALGWSVLRRSPVPVEAAALEGR